jgi:hypothetical protein
MKFREAAHIIVFDNNQECGATPGKHGDMVVPSSRVRGSAYSNLYE